MDGIFKMISTFFRFLNEKQRPKIFKQEDARTPQIKIHQVALSKMKHAIHLCDHEISWLGTVEKKRSSGRNCYIIQDIRIHHQSGDHSTTEIDAGMLALDMQEVLSMPDGIETFNKTRLWGHSHAFLPTIPSHQDNMQMKNFHDVEYMIRLIGNKNGVIRVDLWDYTSNTTWLELKWTRAGKPLSFRQQRNIEAKIAEEIRQKVQYKPRLTDIVPHLLFTSKRTKNDRRNTPCFRFFSRKFW